MKLKDLKRIGALALALALAVTAVPAISASQVEAASKPTIKKSVSTTISGVAALKIAKSGYKIVSVKAVSSKTTVAKVKATKSAVTVYGIKPGSAKVTATVVGTKAGKSKTFKLASTVKVVAPSGSVEAEVLSAGGTTNAYVTGIPAKANVEYISSAPSVCQVIEGGLVRAVSEGNATIEAEITFPKTAMAKKTRKTITLGTIRVNSDGLAAIVGNEKTLNSVLSQNYPAAYFPNGKDITLKTTTTGTINITTTNLNVNLIIDAPNATIVNTAFFNHLKINSIAMYTWKENTVFLGTGDTFNEIELANSSAVNIEVGAGAYPTIIAKGAGEPIIKVESGGKAEIETDASAATPTVKIEDGSYAEIKGTGAVKIDLTATTNGTAEVEVSTTGLTTVTSTAGNAASVVKNYTGAPITETVVDSNGVSTGSNTIVVKEKPALSVNQVPPTANTNEGNDAIAAAWLAATSQSATGNMTANTNDYHIGAWYAILTHLDPNKTYYLVRQYCDQDGNVLATDWGSYTGVTEKFVFSSWGMNLQDTSWHQRELADTLDGVSADVKSVKFSLTDEEPIPTGSKVTAKADLKWPATISTGDLLTTYHIHKNIEAISNSNILATQTLNRSPEATKAYN